MIRKAHEWELLKACDAMRYSPSCKATGVAAVEMRVLQAMVVYDHWTYNSVNAHIYIANPKGFFNPRFLHEVFNYPFNTCGRGIMLLLTPGDSDSLRVSKALGFEEVYRIRDGWKVGVDIVARELRKENCRFLQLKKAA